MFRTEPIRNQLLLGLSRRLRHQTRAYGRRPRRQLGAVPDHGREPQARCADLAAGDAVPQPGLMVAGERTAHRATTSGATRVPNRQTLRLTYSVAGHIQAGQSGSRLGSCPRHIGRGLSVPRLAAMTLIAIRRSSTCRSRIARTACRSRLTPPRRSTAGGEAVSRPPRTFAASVLRHEPSHEDACWVGGLGLGERGHESAAAHGQAHVVAEEQTPRHRRQLPVE
jgi:hypothetical protein